MLPLLENLSVFMLLAGLPLLLWGLPKPRTLNTPWLAAGKIVPATLLVFWLLPLLSINLLAWLNERQNWFPDYLVHHSGLHLVLHLGSLAAAVLAGYGLARLSRRRGTFPPARRLWLPFLVVGLLLAGAQAATLVLFAVARFYAAVADYRSGRPFRQNWTPVFLPHEGETAVVFESTQIHPFLAEYDYRLHFRREGQTTTCNLLRNCGGMTFFKLYRLQDGRLLFADKSTEYIVDAARASVLYVFADGARKFAVALPDERVDSWGWGGHDGKMLFHCNGLPPVEAASVKPLLEGKAYFGCITDRFIPAREQAEQPFPFPSPP